MALFSCKNGVRLANAFVAWPGQNAKNITTNATVNRSGRKKLYALFGVASAGILGTVYALEHSVHASDLAIIPPKYPWAHRGWFAALDRESVRRGYEVYKQVCAACHSMQYVSYLHMVDEVLTETEARTDAAEHLYVDGPDELGKMYERPGSLIDMLPSPYKNDEEAKAANNAALPPDMSRITLIVDGKGGADYIFALLTGYEECPAGVELAEGQAYNPWFPGGVISMPQQLFDDMLEYQDGTPATISQMAKDVSSFLTWAGEPFHDDFKKLRLKVVIGTPVMLFVLWFANRHMWSSVKTMKYFWKAHPFKKH